MAAEATAPIEHTVDSGTKPKERTLSPEALQARRTGEIERVMSNVLQSRHKDKSNAELQADPAAHAIYSSETFANIQEDDLKDGPISFPEKETPEGGKPLTIMVGDKQATLLEINGVEGDENYAAKVLFKGDTEDDDTQATASISRADVFRANMLAERDTIVKGFTFQPDQRQIAETYFQLIDPTVTDKPEITDDLAQTNERVAKQGGMLTSGDVTKIINQLHPEGSAGRDSVKDLLARLEDKTVIDKADFRDMMSAIGISPDTFEAQADTLRAQIDKQEAILKNYPEDEMAKRRLEHAKGELMMVSMADKLWARSREQGKDTPFDDFFDRAQNGQLKQNEVNNLVTSLCNGNYEALFDQFPEFRLPDDATAEQKTAREKAIKAALATGKGAGFLLLFLVAFAGAIAVGTVATAMKQQ